jgi:hypothetical protein
VCRKIHSLGALLCLFVIPIFGFADPTCPSSLRTKAELNLHRDGIKFLPKVQMSEAQLQTLQEVLSEMSPFRQLALSIGEKSQTAIFGFHQGDFSIDDTKDLDQITTPYKVLRKHVLLEQLGLQGLAPQIYEIKERVFRLSNRKVHSTGLVSLVWNERLRVWDSTTSVSDEFEEIGQNQNWPFMALPDGWNILHGAQSVAVFVNLNGPGVSVLTKDGRRFHADQGEPVAVSTKNILTERYKQAYPLTAVRWNSNQDQNINLHLNFYIEEEGSLEF